MPWPQKTGARCVVWSLVAVMMANELKYRNASQIHITDTYHYYYLLLDREKAASVLRFTSPYKL